MIDFKLIDIYGNEKNKEILNGFLINASMRDKIIYKCIITNEPSERSVNSIVKLKNHSLKKIDLSDETIFMNKKESRKQRMINQYGVENNFQRKEIKEKAKETNIKKYGVDSYTKTDEYKIKSKKAKKERYENENFNNREKAKETNIKKYGVEHQHKNKNVLQKVKLAIRKKGIKSSLELLKENNLEFLNINEYIGQRIENKNIFYTFKCLKCNNVFKDHLHSKIPLCPFCFPKYRSSPELEIEDFIKSFGFKTLNSRRDIIPPYEIDIYIPEKNIAIELNGLYWHSQNKGGKGNDYHLNKTNLAKEKGINLLHIFEDEWKNKKEIVKSIIKNKLNIIDEKVFARKCKVAFLKSKDLYYFYENNHIQGHVNSFYNLALVHEDEIVCALSLSKSRFEKNTLEITRFANKLNISVIGGFSKLFKNFLKENNFQKIVTYSDRRFFDGNIYINNGFNFVGYTNPGYFYIDNNYLFRYNRVKFQKHKLEGLLESYDKNLTEWQNMQANGYDRIWDCGNYKFEYKVE